MAKWEPKKLNPACEAAPVALWQAKPNRLKAFLQVFVSEDPEGLVRHRPDVGPTSEHLAGNKNGSGV